MSTNVSLQSEIPAKILSRVKGKKVVETSFATGPSFCAGKVETHNPAITFEQGIEWLERYQANLKAGCIIFDDESRLWFSWGKFDRYVRGSIKDRPRPGASLVDLTDPKELNACGLKRKGNLIVSDDEEEYEFWEYTPAELARAISLETKSKRRR